MRPSLAVQNYVETSGTFWLVITEFSGVQIMESPCFWIPVHKHFFVDH